MAACGNKVTYKQQRTRYFIDATHNDDVLQRLMDSFLASMLAYISQPHFPEKYVVGQYQAYLKKKTRCAL
jgi:hypothetical protein